MADFGNIFEQFGKAKETIEKMQKDLEKISVVGESGAGMVKITKNGKFAMLNLEIDDSVISEDKEVLIDLIKAADVDANRKVQDAKQGQIGGALSGFGLPPDFNLSDFVGK